MRALAVMTLLLAACTAASPQVPAPPDPTPTQATPSSCEPAPAWLVDAVQSGITTEGAVLGNAFVVPAGEVLDGPPIVLGGAFADAQLIVGIISGGGVLDEPAVWITNGTSADDPGLIYAASAAARRYSDWGADAQPDILAEQFTVALGCVQ